MLLFQICKCAGIVTCLIVLSVGGVISGSVYTLIHMVVGDVWTLYIPYQSGYGSSTGNDGNLQAYSALVYNVRLEKIVER